MSGWILAHIITRLELGGAQLATLHQVTHSTFAARPHYLLYGPGGLLDSEVPKLPGVQGVALPALGRAIDPLSDARALHAIYTALKDIKSKHPDHKLLVHTHSSKAGILGRWAAKAARADKIVHSIHGFGHQPGMPPALFYALWATERAACAITDGLTADSAANLRRGRQEHLFGSTPTCVVHCGVDVAAFAEPHGDVAALRQSLHIAADAKVVLMVACLKPQKDPLTFLEVAARVRSEFPDVVFLLAGDGELRPSLQTHIGALKLHDTVKLLGWRRDVPTLLHAADVLLLTSRWEGLPQVFGQAMAAGKPIVATDVDGNSEAVIDGVNGLLRKVGDVQGLTHAVLTLLRGDAERQRMGRAGAARAHVFSEASMVKTLDGFYGSLTEK